MEWFRRPDGSVAVSEVGARPPGAQFMTSMSYAHDIDMYRRGPSSSCTTVRAAAAAVRRGRAYLRGQGRGRGRRRPRARRASAAARALVVEARLPAARAAAASDYEGDGYVIVRDPDTAVVEDGPAARSSHDPGGARGGAVNVLMLSPGLPGRDAVLHAGLAEVGARVIGVGDQPPTRCPASAREALRRLRADRRWPTRTPCSAALRRARARTRDRPGRVPVGADMILAARLREAIGLPGMTVEQTIPFRDKERMKQVLDAAGHPHARGTSSTTHRRRRAGRPPSGSATRSSSSRSPAPARSTPTAIDDASELDRRAAAAAARAARSASRSSSTPRSSPTTRSARAGEIVFENICWYRPAAAADAASTSGSARCHRPPRPRPCPTLAGGRAMGRAVLAALGFTRGFTHMEWYRKARRRGRVRRDRRPAARARGSST